MERRIQKEEAMKCVVCKRGNTKPGTTTVTLERGEFTMVVKDVCAEVCSNCGEAYVDEKTTRRLLRAAEKAARNGAQVEVCRYAIA
jgi:YgiT-type zinc finger domain-containing protein